MKQRLLVGVAFAVAPSVAHAALYLDIGPNHGEGIVDAVVAPGSGGHYLDAVFRVEGLSLRYPIFAYDLYFVVARGGIGLVRASVPDNWVFGQPGSTFQQVEADRSHVMVYAASALDGPLSVANTGSGAARVYYTVEPDAAPGLYAIAFDPNVTGFAIDEHLPARVSSVVIQEHVTPVGIADPGLILVTPEPSVLLPLAAGLLVLRRRRAAAALE